MASPADGALGVPMPCVEQRATAERECEDARTAFVLSEAAAAELAEARRLLHEAQERVERAERDADRHAVAEAKSLAQERYREEMAVANDEGTRRDATAAWMTEVDRLNRRLRRAAASVDRWRQRAVAAHRAVDDLSQAADAHRITAESASARCLDARRKLAVCEEEAVHAGRPAAAAAAGIPAIVRILQGDRVTLRRVAEELAEAAGGEAATIQLLLADLAETIVARAREDGMLRFPERHPFWSRFTPDEGRQLTAALSRMGYRFDGGSGWLGERPPTHRELAIGLAHIGYDVRAVRDLPSTAEVPHLFRGASVAAEEYLVRAAPGLMLDEVTAIVGERAERLGALWDEWGRLRPLLVRRTDAA